MFTAFFQYHMNCLKIFPSISQVLFFFSIDLITCCVDGFSLVQSYLMVFVICTFDVLQKKGHYSLVQCQDCFPSLDIHI